MLWPIKQPKMRQTSKVQVEMNFKGTWMREDSLRLCSDKMNKKECRLNNKQRKKPK